ncbi:hypothetical protein Poly51_37790 [Rubripirellula tenax]|uniref:Zinc-finger domain-containing protein n=1 Tax=Rubripirellula tenax TaxID=2528015 RepID=A0A5C6EQB7_9BACT|nr:hypothetical protein Poly51_37790 [Rubripirellula tenax]
MSEHICHPTKADLQGLWDGRINREQADLISRHLDECEACLACIELISLTSDPLIAKLIGSNNRFRFSNELSLAQARTTLRRRAHDMSSGETRNDH